MIIALRRRHLRTRATHPARTTMSCLSLVLGLSLTTKDSSAQSSAPQPFSAQSNPTRVDTIHISTNFDGLRADVFKRYAITALGGQTSAYSDTTQGGAYGKVTFTRYNGGKARAQLAVAHYTQQDISERFGFATDTSLNIGETQASFTFFAQTSATVKINTTALFRTTASGSSYMLRPEAVVTVLDPISIVFAMRPTYDGVQKRWSNAAEFGAHVRLPYQQSLSARMIQTSRRYLQSPVTAVIDYEATVSSIFEVRAGFAHGNGGAFRFTSGWGTLTGMLTPNFGLTAEFKQRNGTFARRAIGAGLLGRF